MSTFDRLKISTAVIAALMAGLVLHGGDAHAKNGNGRKGGQGNVAVANGAPADSALKIPPYTCRACRFVKRDKDDSKPGHDMSGHDKSKHHDKGHYGHDKHKKDYELTCKGIAGCRPLPHPGGTTGSVPPAHKPGAPATPPLATVRISNGTSTSLIKDAPGGLLVTSTSPGTITISNGKNSVTFPNEAVSLSGAVSVGAGAGVQVFREKNGDIVALAKPPAPPAPAPMPPGPVVRDHRPGGNASHVTVTGHHDSGVLDTIGGAIKDVGGAIKDAGKAVIEAPFAHGGPTPGTPAAVDISAPKTSTTTQN
jgi:hypothetical protein